VEEWVSSSRKGIPIPTPYLQLQDNERTRVLKVLNALGGGTCSPKRKSWYFRISSSNVPQIVLPFRPYAPSRLEMIDAFQAWELASIAKRRKIAQENRAKDRTAVDAQTYRQLLQNPDFFAGVLDARGIWSPYSRRNRRYPRAQIISRNETLLVVLAQEIGGRVYPTYNRGLPVDQVNSFTWESADSQIIHQIAERLKGHTRFPEKIILNR